MQTTNGVFCHPQGFKLWEVGVHFRWRFGSRCILELHGYAIDHHSFRLLRNDFGWRNQAHFTLRDILTNRGIHLPGRPFR
ncbi:Uncharacterised protein [Vibrio cholerae]|uniref:Uncharacterized protein n=1 Tax=Vibrio cholerae TaxID=666 RepID=A0A655R4B2_VIBCL|nr:Uncharacterised protein [Vibrio cholerae]CSA76708.1 Uncharacterised protein [Vibrio cholerae]CSA85385.1 Uncharacterised protein [Vibrio cholerae]CSC42723.1 Uncharacterised protein [Vibrio cholerae]CSC45422.1 Uncharacterised protein [Vibrio cholerae]